MGFSLSDLNPFSAAKKVTKAVAKPFRKASKFLPKELRWAAPYLMAAAPYTSFMYPGSGILSGNVGRGLLSSLYNVAGQGIADPEGEDINLLSTLLAGGQGALTGQGAGDQLRNMTTKGKWGIGSVPEYISGVPENILQDRSFLTKAKDLGLTGLGEAADYLGGARKTLGALGAGEAIPIETSKILGDKLVKETLMKDLFTKAGAKKGLMAAAPIFTQGTSDVFKAEGDKALRAYEAADLEEQRQIDETSTANDAESARLTMRYYRQAGHDEETIKTAMDLNEIGHLYEPPVEEESAAQGGIIGLKNGGMLNLGGNEMDYRGGGFVPIGKRERADDVPARLSKNEFVMTADAVKAAGGGSVNKGAQRMYNVMNNLEARA
jgi:hypothetical protein